MRFAGLISAVSLLLFLSPSAFAWEQVGRAKLKVGPFPIYSCVLLTPDGSYREDGQPVRLELTYKRDIRAHHFVKHAKKEWAHQGLPENVIVANAAGLKGAFPDIEKGETLTFEIQENGTGRLYHGTDAIFTIKDPERAKNFINIWLSEKTSRPKHRERLIGKR